MWFSAEGPNIFNFRPIFPRQFLSSRRHVLRSQKADLKICARTTTRFVLHAIIEDTTRFLAKERGFGRSKFHPDPAAVFASYFFHFLQNFSINYRGNYSHGVLPATSDGVAVSSSLKDFLFKGTRCSTSQQVPLAWGRGVGIRQR